jgi:hypothetical protein
MFHKTTDRVRAVSIVSISLFGQTILLSNNDLSSLAFIGIACVYFAMAAPYLLIAALLSGILSILSGSLQKYLSRFSGWKISVRSWHLNLIALFLAAAVLGQFATPASAQFFNSLETALTNAITTADLGIDATIIASIFLIIRVLVILGFLVGIITIVAQALRGGDATLVLNLLAVGLTLIIAVEVITRLILGNGAAAPVAGAGA